MNKQISSENSVNNSSQSQREQTKIINQLNSKTMKLENENQSEIFPKLSLVPKEVETISKLCTIVEGLMCTHLDKREMYSILFDNSIMYDNEFQISDRKMAMLVNNLRNEVINLKGKIIQSYINNLRN